MPVCGNCVIIPNCYRYTIYFSEKRETCCKCKEYKEYVERVKYYNCPQKNGPKTN